MRTKRHEQNGSENSSQRSFHVCRLEGLKNVFDLTCIRAIYKIVVHTAGGKSFLKKRQERVGSVKKGFFGCGRSHPMLTSVEPKWAKKHQMPGRPEKARTTNDRAIGPSGSG